MNYRSAILNIISILAFLLLFTFSSQAAEAVNEFMVISYNIHGNYGAGGVSRPKRNQMGTDMQRLIWLNGVTNVHGEVPSTEEMDNLLISDDKYAYNAILAVQEDWIYTLPHNLCNAWSSTRQNIELKYKSCPHHIRNCPVLTWNDGLNIFTNFEFLNPQGEDPEGKIDCQKIIRVRWQDRGINLKELDHNAEKGFSFTRVKVAEGFEIDFYNAHVGPYSAKNPLKTHSNTTRINNIYQLASYINEHSANRAVILVGDLNLHWLKEFWNSKNFDRDVEAFKYLKEKVALKSACEEMKNCTCQNGNEFSKCSDSERWYLPHSIALDQIMYRGNENYDLNVSEFKQINNKKISDHEPVMARFIWKRKNE